MHTSMKTYGGVDVNVHAFFTSALTGGVLLASRPSRLTPWENPVSIGEKANKTIKKR
jgi:hypothetical protein